MIRNPWFWLAVHWVGTAVTVVAGDPVLSLAWLLTVVTFAAVWLIELRAGR